ncbi:hypothetical protein FDP41_003390 [Naegleria fowleri]|uniref:Uncharacterized protein n=1 Tax=Naegleria fowleri TaxID=5763 RepID=A0A6A5BTY3_NAEFO|nr:uncharacterized protein FDP41_003390 [Naegleria fowleri]KAF0977398.1 hypothetical protein FDP41_003390 [Naegleria fowleri]
MRGNHMRALAKRASALISSSSTTGRASSSCIRMFSTSTSSVMKIYGSSEMSLFNAVSSSSSSRNSSSRNISIRNMANGAAFGQFTVFGSNDDDG